MKILGELFQIVDIAVTDSFENGGGTHCEASLVPLMDSPVFAAHFPGRPVVPGACIVAAVEELLCKASQQSLHIVEIKNVKFISLVEPKEGVPLTFEMDIDKESYKVKAVVKYSGMICSKMSVTFNRS